MFSSCSCFSILRVSAYSPVQCHSEARKVQAGLHQSSHLCVGLCHPRHVYRAAVTTAQQPNAPSCMPTFTRCKHKLHQRHLVSVRTLSSKQQATHVLQVLTVAKDSFHNFTTAFKLAVLLSTHTPASFTGITQQQQHQQVGSAAQSYVEQGELDEKHWWQQDDAEAAEASTHSQQQTSNSIAAASRSASHPADRTAHSSDSGDAAVAGDAAAQQEGPQCAPAGPLSRSSHHSLDPSTPVAAGGADTTPRQQSGRVPQQSTAEPAAAVEIDAELEGLDDGPVADSAAYHHDDSSLDMIAEWERSQEGWQGLMQRAWRGNVGAVLACAQELIHGGDFCLQDCHLARQLLQTVSRYKLEWAWVWGAACCTGHAMHQ